MREEIRRENLARIHNSRFRCLYQKPQSMFGAILVLLGVATVTLAILHAIYPTQVMR